MHVVGSFYQLLYIEQVILYRNGIYENENAQYGFQKNISHNIIYIRIIQSLEYFYSNSYLILTGEINISLNIPAGKSVDPTNLLYRYII